MPFAKRYRGLEISRDIQTKCSKSTCPTLRQPSNTAAIHTRIFARVCTAPLCFGSNTRISAQLEVGVATSTCQITWLAGKSGGIALYRNYSCSPEDATKSRLLHYDVSLPKMDIILMNKLQTGFPDEFCAQTAIFG
eukprot:sb/3474665/